MPSRNRPRQAPRRPHGQPPPGEYWILDRGQLQCLVSPLRTDMVDRLAASGPLSIRELAAGIGKQPSALYRHMELLLAAGLVVEAGTRVVRRKQEKLYATPAPRMRLIHALADPRFADVLVELVATLGRQMTRDFAHGIARPDARTLGDDRNLGLFRLVSAPGPKALAEVNHHLNEILEILLAPPDPNAPFLALAWTMSPVRSRSTPVTRPFAARASTSRASTPRTPKRGRAK